VWPTCLSALPPASLAAASRSRLLACGDVESNQGPGGPSGPLPLTTSQLCRELEASPLDSWWSVQPLGTEYAVSGPSSPSGGLRSWVGLTARCRACGLPVSFRVLPTLQNHRCRASDRRAFWNRPVTVLSEPRSEPSEAAFCQSDDEEYPLSPDSAPVSPVLPPPPRELFQRRLPVGGPFSVADAVLEAVGALPHHEASQALGHLLLLQEPRDSAWPFGLLSLCSSPRWPHTGRPTEKQLTCGPSWTVATWTWTHRPRRPERTPAAQCCC
jgi:hypothetical protein